MGEPPPPPGWEPPVPGWWVALEWLVPAKPLRMPNLGVCGVGGSGSRSGGRGCQRLGTALGEAEGGGAVKLVGVGRGEPPHGPWEG